MKFALSTILLFLFFTNGFSSQSAIGVFVDEQGYYCTANIIPYVYLELNILVYNSPYDFPYTEVTGLEFSIQNLPTFNEYPHGMYEFEWFSEMTVGDLATGVRIDLDPPLDVSSFFTPIGTATFLEFDDAWMPDYHLICIGESDLGGGVILYPPNADPFFVERNGSFGFNWDTWEVLYCFDDYYCFTPVKHQTWSAIKSLYR